MIVPSNREETLFERALGIGEPEARDAFLREGCSDDAAMLARLQGLLGAHDRAGGFLEHKASAPEQAAVCDHCGRLIAPHAPQGLCAACLFQAGLPAAPVATTPEHAAAPAAPARTTAPAIPAPIFAAASAAEQPGALIGRYKLLEKIGEGGMGVVWMAQQEEPVRRRVALKVIKLGMDTREVVARFEAERQALALMDHPNIAKVFDGGATGPGEGGSNSAIDNRQSQIPPGRPYFVMELVRGLPITKYCDEARLGTRQRLELFGHVCRAVQHAHQKGVIHRDLKPSNILVTEQDGRPVPKVIDFGIAKATAGRLTDKTLFTGFAQIIGTPAYMSPEQAGLGSLDIDTRSDTYSLGVILYELLAGRPPFDTKELLQQGYEAVLRTIREVDPPKPSTRLTDLVGADVRRRTPGQPDEFASSRRRLQELRGDLDWIVMKCLEKDRNRRYETANGLSADLERYLHDEPILARPPSALYRWQKFASKHRVGVAAAATVILALLAGLAVSTWALVRERAARQQARAQATRSEQVAQLLKDVFKGVAPSVALGRDTTMLREILDKGAERIGKDLIDQPEVEAELRNTMGRVYLALGEYDRAERMHRQALGLLRERLGNEDPDLARTLNELASVRLGQDQIPEAETLLHEALAIQRKLFGSQHPDIASTLNTLASALRNRGELAEAEAMFRQALLMRRELLGNEHSDVVQSLNNIALLLRDQGKPAEAEPLFREALARRRQWHTDEHPEVATVLNNLGLVLSDQGNYAEAVTLEREALAMWKKLVGKDAHPKVAEPLDNLGTILRRQGRPAEAETVHREALTLKRMIFGNEHTAVATSLNNLGQALSEQDKLKEAEGVHREALAMFKKVLTPEHPHVAVSLNNLANALYKQRKLTEAEAGYREALTMHRKLSGSEHPEVATALINLGFVLADLGKLPEAETLLRDGLAMQRKLFTNEHPKVATALNNLGLLLQRRSNLAEAESMLREALAIRRRFYTNDHRLVADSLGNLGGVLRRQGKLTAAENMEREALAMRRTLWGNEHLDVAKSLYNLAVVLQGQGKLVEIEPLARECLVIREKKLPDDWRTFETGSLLGLSLLAQEKYAEAQPLLLSSYEGLKRRESKLPADGKTRLKEVAEWIVRLYEAWGKPDQAAEWREMIR